MRKYAIIFTLTALLFTAFACVKDGYKTADSVYYTLNFEVQNEEDGAGGTFTFYNSLFDSAFVKGILYKKSV